ncbi:hypothetical protein PF008_g11718 [Phytophthora fragariae]|uniref:Uncharacterized protein n=1 Tax=Phytophthora fragariae TaxID=53985 RepID=A0A6G0RQ36_9STRA|nr:hypothetical protein PF008_g11718 [Phytophthora fragariae]
MSIDVRWTNTSRSLQRVKQFTYEAYRKDGKKTRLAEKRTSAQRYRAAARATHLICTEMADIEDEDEFDDLLDFLMTNWRNVRQRKMPTSSGADNTAMDASTASTRKNGGAKDDWQLAEDAKVEFDLSSGDSENVPDEDEMEEKEPIPGGVDIDLNEQAAPTIRLNPKARKARRQRPAPGHERDRVAKTTLRALLLFTIWAFLTREGAEQHEAEAAEEDEKMHAPVPPAASNADEEDDVPPTQVAK